jgi:hypothetical protein
MMHVNPFDPTRPVSDPAAFFGRQDAFGMLRRYVAGGQSPHVALIIAGKGMGKTSLLWQTPNHLESRYLCLYVDAAVINKGGLPTLYATLAETVLAALEDISDGAYRPDRPDLANLPPADIFWGWLADSYIGPFFALARRFRRVVILLDNVDALVEAQMFATFGEPLSQALQQDERLAAVFALTPEVAVDLEETPLIGDPLLWGRLPFLADEEVAAVSRAGHTSPVEEEAIASVVALSGGHPALVQIVNAAVWAYTSKEPNQPITMETVRRCVPAAMDGAKPILGPLWEKSSQAEKATLAALAELVNGNDGRSVTAQDIQAWLIRNSDAPPNETSLAAALRRLEYRQAIRTVEGGAYTSTSKLLDGLIAGFAAFVTSGVEAPPKPTRGKLPIAPLSVLVIFLLGAFLLANRLGVGAANRGQSTPDGDPTLTLALDVVGTRNAISASETFAALPTATDTLTFTATASHTATHTHTATFTFTPSNTATASPTFTPSQTATTSNTPTASFTFTATSTFTASHTPTNTPSPTATHTATVTFTATATFTATGTQTATLTPPAFPTAQIRVTSAP